ncbi:hypothetical protein L6452_20924 [Arctium lappa]|uniref:Uncharacterized protein n=1 Tax=Arctium lappa TaxID=4217 RepID=A0ACB9BC93_ARCLA|nr:hypothetical protein L6452_20924 [Arctium lappa]
MESVPTNKRVRLDSDDSESNSIQPKRLRDDLLVVLPDSDVCTVTPDLESLMKSFENEISELPHSIADRETASGESRPDLGFLFEASDDELGLPPTDLTPVETEKNGVSAESVEVLGEIWRLEDQMFSYDSFEYGFGYADDDAYINTYNNVEYVALDGLFDYTDLGFASSELSLQPETTPAQRKEGEIVVIPILFFNSFSNFQVSDCFFVLKTPFFTSPRSVTYIRLSCNCRRQIRDEGFRENIEGDSLRNRSETRRYGC